MRRFFQFSGAILMGATFCASAVQAQEGMAGVGAASGMAAGLGASAASSIRPSDLTRRMPSVSGGDMGDEIAGGGARAVGSTTTTTTTTRIIAPSVTGETFLTELLRSRNTRPTTTRRKRSARAQAAYSSRVSRQTSRQRSRGVMAKYQIPAVGWRGRYLPADRYKFGKVWQFVSIEDDSGAYPVKYYYRPWSSSMMNLLARKPRRGQARYGRVIGFRSWQDAMLAGYRPDPISRPEPANDVVYMAGLGRTPQLGRYVEMLYNGQVAPATHAYNVSYVRQVAQVVRSRADTRPLMASTISQVIGAMLGENPLPQRVGRVVRRTTTTSTTATTGGAANAVPGAAPVAAPAGGTDKREEDFNKFGSRAGSLAATPGNR